MASLYAADRWTAAQAFQRRYAQDRKARLITQARDEQLDWEIRELAKQALRAEYAAWTLPADLRR